MTVNTEREGSIEELKPSKNKSVTYIKSVVLIIVGVFFVFIPFLGDLFGVYATVMLGDTAIVLAFLLFLIGIPVALYGIFNSLILTIKPKKYRKISRLYRNLTLTASGIFTLYFFILRQLIFWFFIYPVWTVTWELIPLCMMGLFFLLYFLIRRGQKKGEIGKFGTVIIAIFSTMLGISLTIMLITISPLMPPIPPH
ncbi:MAG: hypothetical protein ACW98D_18230 [Promethearchaeota archaeon]|jgi:hypothetical protein